MRLKGLYPYIYEELYGKRRYHLEWTREQLWTFMFSGFKIGDLSSEMLRAYYVLMDGREEFIDVELFMKWRAGNICRYTEHGGDMYPFAQQLLRDFDEVAARVTRERFEEEPSLRESQIIWPVYRWLEHLNAEGVPVFGFTANTRGFIEAALEELGLERCFLFVVTDTEVPGPKWQRVKWLFDKILPELGMPEPPVVTTVGDSFTGDVYAAYGATKNFGLNFKPKGVLIAHSDEDFEKALQKAAEDPNLAEMLRKAEVSILMLHRLGGGQKAWENLTRVSF